MKKIKLCIAIIISLFLVSCSLKRDKPTWVLKSDDIAQKFTKDFSEIYPELGSSLGMQQFDPYGTKPGAKTELLELELLKNWKNKINILIKNEKDKNLLADYNILLENIQSDLKWKRVDAQIHFVPIPHASKLIYNSIFQLINPQTSGERKESGVDRFLFYMDTTNKLNIVAAYRQEITRHQVLYPERMGLYPYVGKLRNYLEDSSKYLAGIKIMLKNSGRSDWTSAYKLFHKEVSNYDQYLRREILPLARVNPNFPIQVYKQMLGEIGVDKTPDEMIRIGQTSYKKLFIKYKNLANKIAKKWNLKESTPIAVIKHLKLKQVVKKEDVARLYKSASKRLTRIIKQNQLVTLPKTNLQIRFAGDAESSASPVPHLNPPPLLNNDGILPEFVVPTSSSGNLSFDDFSHSSAATVLTAHEGRPGHDLQFTRMLESPVSIIRARFAMNSVNVEGWALYAEKLVFPFLTIEEQFIATQTTLWRMARYYLDPMVQLGRVERKSVINLFHKQLGISKTLARLEYERYAFRSPGQATAYYHGLLKIEELKSKLTRDFGPLVLRCFNDTLLSFGLLPHDKIYDFKNSFGKCQTK